ncbi:hypothetical protein [Microbacterium sp. Root180]|uniref:hypothetical protein n=1 Tax=Microbacterium sp. Root180 TaxID=1736483 RepID=UPI0006FD0148|nr:hypothetical protein [Microbacterium sp. Root180]KRB38478.1 hypothetical protein ASD93_00445 [Microbacterium sp. Root180]
MSKRTSGGRARGDLLAWSLIAVFFAVPLGTTIAGAAMLAADQAQGPPAPEPVFAHIARRDFVDAQTVSITLAWSDGIALKAPAWGGLITESGVKPGDVVRSGTRIVRVDGVWRVAASTPAPYYAPVSQGSSPGDVKSVNALLRDMGFDAPGDSWSWSTSVALREFARGIGVPDADAVSAMDPAWLVWSPTAEIVVAALPLTVGTGAPGQGEDVLLGPPRLASVSVAAEDGATLPDVDAEGEWILRVAGESMPYRSPEMTDDLAGSGIERALAASRPSEAEGLVERAETIEGWQVPVSAVHTDAAGAHCVFRRDESDAGYRAVRVDVQRGTIGTARVDGPLRPHDEILVNPSAVAGDAECG